MSSPKRRLPVLQPKDDDSEGEARPAWHWAGLGALATLLALLPLSMAAAWLAKRTYDAYVPGTSEAEVQAALTAMTPGQRLWLGILVVVGPVLALGLAALAGGAFVGRFGEQAGPKEALVAGLLAAAVTSAIAARELVERPGGAGLWLLTSGVLFVVAGAAALVGGVLGRRLRRAK